MTNAQPTSSRTNLALGAVVLTLAGVGLYESLTPVAQDAPTVIVRWSNANPQPVSFDVFSGIRPDVDAMALRVNTTNLYAEFLANQTQEFFAVRARRGTNVSRWGTK